MENTTGFACEILNVRRSLMFCIYCGATLPEGAKKCTLCGNPVVRPPEATVPPISEPEPAPVPETPAEPTPEDISSSSAEAPDETIVVPESEVCEDASSSTPDGEDIYSNSPTDFTEDISSGDALGDEPEGTEHELTFTVSPAPEELSSPEPRVQPVEDMYNDGYAYEEYDEKPKKKRSFKWLFIVLPILIAIGATAGGIFWWYNSPMQKLTRALDAYDYSAAAQVLPTLSTDELASVSDQMQEYAQTVIDRYNKGEAAYDGSYELLDRLQKLFPNVSLDDKLDSLTALKDSKEAYKNGKDLQAQGEDGRAITEYQKVIHADVNHDDAQTQIQNIRSAYKEKVLSDAQSRADEKDFLGAEAILMNSSDILGDDEDIKAKMEELQEAELNDYVETLLGTAKTLADSGDLPGAVNVLQDATRSDKRIDAQIVTYKNQYKQKILDAAAKQAAESRYYDAVETLQDADDIVSGDSDISAKIDEYRALYPVSLTDLSPSGGEDCNKNWTAYDANGNSYSNGLSFSLYPVIAKSVSTEYAPNGQYKRLTGTWVVEGDTSSDFIGTVRIYVDGNLQYEVSSLTVNSPASALSLSISGASTIRIEVEGAFATPRSVGYLYLANAKFEN